MTRINPNIRRPPKPEDAKPKSARTSRQKRQRQTADQEYNALSDVYKEENGQCNYCGESFDADDLENDHIVSGTAGRSVSLLHFDTWNTACPSCHRENPERAEKAAAKVVNVLRAIEQLQGRNFDFREDMLILKAVVNRESGHTRG